MIRTHRNAFRTVAALAVAVPLGVLVLGGCSANLPHSVAALHDAKYDDLPSFLPQDSIRPDGVLTGTATRPALTAEGDAVKAVFAGGSALVTVTGPEVPGEGLPHQAAATTCTWTVTITAISGSVPVRSSDFSSIDHLGVVSLPAFVAGQPDPATVLTSGEKATFELRAYMMVGEGLMRWSPDGTRIVSSWDFEVEND